MHERLETFPSNTADFDRKNFAEGWNYIVNTSLKSYLEAHSFVAVVCRQTKQERGKF
jgi:hypothetical protein